jgi:hypothetical protein
MRAHHVTWSPNKLWRSTCEWNLRENIPSGPFLKVETFQYVGVCLEVLSYINDFEIVELYISFRDVP